MNPYGTSRIGSLVLILVSVTFARAAAETKTATHVSTWPQFRGPGARGLTSGKAPPAHWSTTENVAWKIKVPGRGWSSPVVWGDRLFLTSCVNEGKSEFPKKGLYFGGNRLKPLPYKHRWIVYCIDTRTGKIVWEKLTHGGKPEESHHIKNTLASETPVTDGKRVYAYFGNLGLFTYDMESKLLWSRRWKTRKTRYGWGTAASPVLYGDTLYILNDNEEESYLVALDAKTGVDRWHMPRDEKSNWATPMIWSHKLRTEIVTAGTGRVRSYDLSGKLLWELRGMSSITIPTPFAAHGLLYVSSGYVLDSHRPVYAIKPGASGDISLADGETSNQFIQWYDRKAGPYNPSPIVYGDYLYVLLDRGFFTCYEAKSGKRVYGKQRISNEAAAFTTSPWAYDGKIFCLSEDGDTFVIQSGSEYRLLHKNSLEEMCMACPAIVDGSLYVRTLNHLYKIAAEGKAGKD